MKLLDLFCAGVGLIFAVSCVWGSMTAGPTYGYLWGGAAFGALAFVHVNIDDFIKRGRK
jgi:hypothetical protein